MTKKIEHTTSSGNVFADLGFADAGERLAKAQLAGEIARLLEKAKLTQKELAGALDATQSDVSLLTNHKFDRFSTDRLMQILTRLGRDVEITIKPKPSRRSVGRLTVKAA
jgi:predicted XRE-type DNA-binding protein